MKKITTKTDTNPDALIIERGNSSITFTLGTQVFSVDIESMWDLLKATLIHSTDTRLSITRRREEAFAAYAIVVDHFYK